MNPQSFARAGWLKLSALIVLAAGSLGGGYFLATYPTGTVPDPKADKTSTPSSHRFPLTVADAKERMESPEVAVDAAGRVYLIWASQTGPEERTLYLTHSDNAGHAFAQPRAFASTGIAKFSAQMKGKAITRDSKMAPHLALSGNALHLAWTETLPGNAGVRMVVATSTNQGKSFGATVQVHQSEKARPTFTALAANSQGDLLCSWLDNRSKTQQTYASTLRSGKDAFEPEEFVHGGDDRGVCPCCPTASIFGTDGTCYVAFRNVASGFRDIHIGRKKPGADKFEVLPIVPPTWTFSGCPHDGPSMAIVGETMYVAWMDGHSGAQRCYFGSASLADMKFSVQDLHTITVGSQGNAKLCADSTGKVHAVWEESAEASEHGHEHGAPKIGSGRAVMHAVFSPQTKSFSDAHAMAAASGKFQSRPSVAVGADRMFVAFHELDESGKSVVLVALNQK